MIQLRLKRVARFSERKEDGELDRRLQELQTNIEDALRALDRSKRAAYSFTESSAASVQGMFGECAILDTTVVAIDFFLPTTTSSDAGRRVAVVRISAANAVTTRAPATTIGGTTSHAPSAAVLTEYETNGREWWVA